MGLGKKPNVVLTARDDHRPGSPMHVVGGPKIHFDLSGYDILFWDSSELDTFREELEKRVRRRRALLAPAASVDRPDLAWDRAWLEAQREVSQTGLSRIGREGFMEVAFALAPPKGVWHQPELLNAVRAANISTFGWPLGIVIDRQDKPWRPRSIADGVVAEIEIPAGDGDRESYDYWIVRRNGDLFLLQDLFEDQRTSGQLFLDTRIHRVTEALLFCGRLYNALQVPPTSMVSVRIRHGGLRDRALTVANRRRQLFDNRTTSEDSSDAEVTFNIDELDAQLVALVTSLTRPLFTLFDFFELSPEVYEDLVSGFVAGEIR